MKTFAVNVERQRQNFAKIVAIRSPPLFSKIWMVKYRRKFSKKRLYLLLFFHETPVTAGKFLKNPGNRRYFSTKYRRFCDFFTADPPLS